MHADIKDTLCNSSESCIFPIVHLRLCGGGSGGGSGGGGGGGKGDGEVGGGGGGCEGGNVRVLAAAHMCSVGGGALVQ